MSSQVLREKRQALLNQMLHSIEPESAVSLPIPRRDPLLPAPLSFSQERLWFLDKLAMGSQFYVENSATRLDFEVDASKLELAINTIVARHEVLRIHCEMLDERPVQVAASTLHIPLNVIDLSTASPTEQ